jgi:hypothetical protein
MATYEITITRGPATDRRSKGTLKYSGTITHECDCYWNKDKRIPAATYARCSKTNMTNATNSKGRKREAIYIKDVDGYEGIFIHYGTNLTNANSLAVWSKGCIVMDEDDVLKIWNDITPKDGFNVTVTVDD